MQDRERYCGKAGRGILGRIRKRDRESVVTGRRRRKSKKKEERKEGVRQCGEEWRSNVGRRGRSRVSEGK
jgi:hypothetical protein